MEMSEEPGDQRLLLTLTDRTVKKRPEDRMGEFS